MAWHGGVEKRSGGLGWAGLWWHRKRWSHAVLAGIICDALWYGMCLCCLVYDGMVPVYCVADSVPYSIVWHLLALLCDWRWKHLWHTFCQATPAQARQQSPACFSGSMMSPVAGS